MNRKRIATTLGPAALLIAVVVRLAGGCSAGKGLTAPETSIVTVSLRVSLTAPARAQVLALELDDERVFTLDRGGVGGCQACFLSATSLAVPSGEHVLRVVAVEHSGGTAQDDAAGYFWLGTLGLTGRSGSIRLIDLEGARPITQGDSFVVARFATSG